MKAVDIVRSTHIVCTTSAVTACPAWNNVFWYAVVTDLQAVFLSCTCQHREKMQECLKSFRVTRTREQHGCGLNMIMKDLQFLLCDIQNYWQNWLSVESALQAKAGSKLRTSQSKQVCFCNRPIFRRQRQEGSENTILIPSPSLTTSPTNSCPGVIGGSVNAGRSSLPVEKVIHDLIHLLSPNDFSKIRTLLLNSQHSATDPRIELLLRSILHLRHKCPLPRPWLEPRQDLHQAQGPSPSDNHLERRSDKKILKGKF